jgi:hypothetical protein
MEAKLKEVLGMLAQPKSLVQGFDKTLAREVTRMLKAYAPRIWFHPREADSAMDPLRFVQDASFWIRRHGRGDELIAERGKVKPEEIAAVQSQPTARYFLRYEGSLGRDTASAQRPVVDPPILWKLGVLPPPTGRIARNVVLLEYWYHMAYSRGVFGIGDHQGDWEGLSFLVELGFDAKGRLTHRPLAAYYAAHEGGKWHRPEELSWIQDPETGRHPEAFSALGSHATYPSAGKFNTVLIIDVTDRGKAWDTWKSLRPLNLEPYFGYSGAWGAASFFSFMSGPLVPGPTKTLPKLSAKERIPAGLF